MGHARGAAGHAGAAGFSALVLAVSLSMTTVEFIEIQQLPVEALRARFRLPASCEPTVTALTTDATANRMQVAVECRPKPAPNTPEPPARR
jgi:hypothetical protein